MTLFDYYLRYMTQVWEGSRPAPEGIRLPEDGDQEERMRALSQQLQTLGMAAFVRACAAQDGTVLPDELFTGDDGSDSLEALLQSASAAEDPAPNSAFFEPDRDLSGDKCDHSDTSGAKSSGTAEPDPDAGKHAFEVFLDCIALDDSLVQYLTDVLKRMDRKEFFKLSQITTKMDLDPEEFLYWLAHRQDYADQEEAACAAVMDAALLRLSRENRLDVVAALLSGDQNTFETFRCEAEELVHLPVATYDWYCHNYLDRDYPIRLIMRLNGVSFPD